MTTKRTTRAKSAIVTETVANPDGVEPGKARSGQRAARKVATAAKPAARSESAPRSRSAASRVKAEKTASPAASALQASDPAPRPKVAPRPTTEGDASAGAAIHDGVAAATTPSSTHVAKAKSAVPAYPDDILMMVSPDYIDPQRTLDRMPRPKQDDIALMESIRDHGQQTPIIVRRHPTKRKRLQLAAGGRRLKAIRALGLFAKVIIRRMSDDEMVLTQGLENVARRDLSYIERALFVIALEAKGYPRKLAAAALNIDETERSRIAGQASRIKRDIIDKVGPAPSIGRTRWAALDDALKVEGARELALSRIKRTGFSKLSSDERFAAVLEAVQQKASVEHARQVVLASGLTLASVKHSRGACSLRIDENAAPGFSDFLTGRLEELLAEFMKTSRAQKIADERAARPARKPRSAEPKSVQG